MLTGEHPSPYLQEPGPGDAGGMDTPRRADEDLPRQGLRVRLAQEGGMNVDRALRASCLSVKPEQEPDQNTICVQTLLEHAKTLSARPRDL